MRNLFILLLILMSMLHLHEARKKAKMPAGVNIARAARGFKHQGKFYKVLGPKGKGRLAFQKLEETREETEEKNGHQNDKELEIQEKEAAYYQYLEQRAVAKKRGLDPESVEIPEEAKEFLKENHVGKSLKKKKDHRKKREVSIDSTHKELVNTTNGVIDGDFNSTINEDGGSFNLTKNDLNSNIDNKVSKKGENYTTKSQQKIRRDVSGVDNIKKNGDIKASGDLNGDFYKTTSIDDDSFNLTDTDEKSQNQNSRNKRGGGYQTKDDVTVTLSDEGGSFDNKSLDDEGSVNISSSDLGGDFFSRFHDNEDTFNISDIDEGDDDDLYNIEDVLLDIESDIDSISNNTDIKRRRKRFAEADTELVWTNAIIPYVFTEDIANEEMELGRLRAQQRYEYWTCIRFVPWTSKTSSKYDLDHNNYLKHVDDDGCWAIMGNTKGDGQRISCCDDEICIHELGHAVGLHHEQKNYLHSDFVRVNYDNIQESKMKEFIEVEPGISRTFGYYDLSSRMHYSLFSFNKNGKPVMTISDPELEYMVLAPDPYHYYQFYEASEISKCKELKCPDFKDNCENGGFVSYIRGRCICRCPDGLDPYTGCTKKYYGDTTLSFLWPIEGFSLWKGNIGCPPGFVDLSAGTLFNINPELSNAQFCTKLPGSSDSGYSNDWQPGTYCIFQYDGKCPKGFISKGVRVKRQIEDLRELIADAREPDDLRMLLGQRPNAEMLDNFLCCRKDGSVADALHMPDNHPFVLIKNSNECQQIKGMTVSEMALKDGPMKDRVCLYTPSEYANGFESWPGEDFALFSPLGGCPSGLEEDVVGHRANKYFTSDSYHLATKLEDNVFSSKICKHKKTGGRGQTNTVKPMTMWEPGHYCIMKNGRKCPEGFEEGNIKTDKSDGLDLDFCCRHDGSTLDHMVLPSREPLVLMKKDRKSCQAIKDMESKEEWYLVRTESEKPFTITGETPFTRNAGEASLYFYFCYYWPINHDCGDIITLTSENPTVQIQSPNYPQTYNDQQVCAWTILSPPDTQMILNFDYFDVEAGDDDTCIDALEVRFSMPGQPGINYCGENFNFTTVSEENYLGLIFTSDTAGQRQGFSASIKLLTKTEMCYTGKGEDYRGTVNVTRRFEPCLPWSQVQDCPHHMFHLKDLDDGLLHNYCRNPGDGTRPWCYTHADECLRNYCDVCNIESCYDVFDDCPRQANENSNFCIEDEEAQRGCAKYCGYCNSVSPPAATTVQCGTPDDVLDSTPVEDLKQTYNVGDEVTYKCNTGTEKEIRRCQPDGTWSMIGFVCGRCPSGWIPYQNKCYKWFDVLQDKSGAREFCKQHDAHLATAKDADEHAFLVEARRFARNVWLGLEYNRKLKGHYWEDDDSLVTWGNWKTGKSKKCAYLHTSGMWFGIGCESPTFMSVICQFTPSVVQICTDARSDCDEIISSEPGACLDFQYFAKQVCPESCGLCINGKGNKCKKTKEPKHVIELTGMKEVRVGQIFEYSCEDGYIMEDGNLRQACLKNGQLTGEPPTCVDKIVDRNNIVEIRERRLDVKSNIVVTALNDEMRIHKNGQIVAWEFYSLYSGEVTFQIWRPDRHKSKFLLVGQNTISDTKDDRKSKRTVATKDQISVQQGDLIGIYVATDTMSGMTYDKCVTDYADGDSGNQLVSDTEVLSAQDWVVGQNYDFKSAKEDCKVYSVTAYVK